MGYLSRIGDDNRAYYLSQFVDTLRRINGHCPWFFQSISGLDEAWKRGFHEEEFKSRLIDRKITIGCLESIDLRMTALMDLYRKACFDWNYYRQVVPWNLRTFSVYVYVYESRTINRTGTPTREVEGPPSPNPSMTERMLGKEILSDFDDPSQINNTTNRLLFRFDQCELIPDDSSGMLEKVGNDKMEMASQKFSFSYRRVYEENLYNLFSDRLLSDEMIGNLDKAALDDSEIIGGYALNSPDNPTPGKIDPKTFKDKLKEQVDKFKEKAKAKLDALGNVFDQDTVLKTVEDQLLARAKNLVGSQVGKAILGNVYGFSPGGIVAAAGAGIDGLVQQAITTAGGPGASFTNTIDKPSGQYFDEVTNNQVTTPNGNVATGPSLNNVLEIANGESNGGASLANVLEQASGELTDGPSADNIEGSATGEIQEGESPSNVNMDPPPGSLTGESAANTEGEPAGEVGGGPSTSNTEGIPTGTVGGGESLSNITEEASGRIQDGQSVGNKTTLAGGKIQEGQSVGNSLTDASGKIQDGQSASNVEQEPASSGYSGVSAESGKASGSIQPGQSVGNVEQEPTPSDYSGASTENKERDASGQIQDGQSVSNRNGIPDPSPIHGESVKNTVQQGGGQIYEGSSTSNQLTEANGELPDGPSRLNRTDEDPIGKSQTGASLENKIGLAHGSVATGPSLSNQDVFHSKANLNDAEGIPGGNPVKDRFEPSMNNKTEDLLRSSIQDGPSGLNRLSERGLTDKGGDQPSEANGTESINERIADGPSKGNSLGPPPHENVNR
jgi:hypothetical protein